MKIKKNKCFGYFSYPKIWRYLDKLLFSITLLLFILTTACNQDNGTQEQESQERKNSTLSQISEVQEEKEHLQRSVATIPEEEMEISTETAHYKPMFGAGDAEAEMVKGIERYGMLTIEPGGKSQSVNYGREELVYYVLDGKGKLYYNNKEKTISKDDFFYVPIDTEHRFSTPSGSRDSLHMMVMGFKLPEEPEVKPASDLQLASAKEVEFKTLEQNNHGPTSRFQLLLGTTRSKRDKLAAASQVLSMYVIDFDHGGTNIPHRHENEEEIYFMLQGRGEMVAGETPEGEPRKFPVKAGDAFFFSRGSQVGFYSGTSEGEEHARILAVRSRYPGRSSKEK